MGRVFATCFGLAFGLAAAGNLPPSPAPSTGAVVGLVLLALWASYRGGVARYRATVQAPAKVIVQESTCDHPVPPVVFTRPHEYMPPTALDLSRWHSPPPSFAEEPSPDRHPAKGIDDQEAAALLEDEYGHPVPPQLAGEVVRQMYLEQPSMVLDTGARPAMLSGQPDERT